MGIALAITFFTIFAMTSSKKGKTTKPASRRDLIYIIIKHFMKKTILPTLLLFLVLLSRASQLQLTTLKQMIFITTLRLQKTKQFLSPIKIVL